MLGARDIIRNKPVKGSAFRKLITYKIIPTKLAKQYWGSFVPAKVSENFVSEDEYLARSKRKK